MVIKYGYCTDIGSSRKVNQDAILCCDGSENGHVLFFGLVCDGIGGLARGELASESVIKDAKDWFDYLKTWIEISTVDGDLVFSHLKDGVEEWNEHVRDIADELGIRCGTTLSAILLLRDRYYLLQMGDSRIYQCNSDYCSQLNEDDVVFGMVRGKMKGVLSNHVGKNEEVSFSERVGEFTPGDMFFFCSDGFYHCLNGEDVKSLYHSMDDTENADALCKEMIDRMISRGEKDNISLGIVKAYE